MSSETKPELRGRRVFQFSLKSIFVLMLIVAAFFGGMAVQRQITERANPKDLSNTQFLILDLLDTGGKASDDSSP